MKALILLILFISFSSFAENRIKVAVIDTGLSYKQSISNYMCDNGHIAVINSNPYDIQGHGTNIISIISKSINPKTHCIVSYKVIEHSKGNYKTILAREKALDMILKDKLIKYINISLESNALFKHELLTIVSLLKRGVVISVAAGNDSINLDKKCHVFPACYKKYINSNNFRIVGAKGSYSNYGSIVTDIFSGYRVGYPIMTGTSQATAQKTAQLLQKYGIK